MRLDFGRRFPRGNAMACVGAQKLGAYGVETQAQEAETLAQNLIGRASLLVCVGPGVNQGTHRFVSRGVTRRDLVEVRGGTAPDACEANPVRSGLIELDGGEIGDAIGR